MPAGRRPAGGRRGDRTGRDPKGPRIRGGGPPQRAFPRVDLVFLCDYNGVLGHVALYGARNQTGWEWLDIKTLPAALSSKLRGQIRRLYRNESYTTYLGCEEPGDPEWCE